MARVLAGFVVLSLIPWPTTAQVVESGVVVGFSQAGPNGPARDNVRPATGRSSIRGRVATSDGRPIRRAEVRIAAPELRAGRRILTNADGNYEFRDLPAGRYLVTASKTTFVNWAFGQTQPGVPGKTLAVADGQVVDDINIVLPHGAVITGRIADEFGDPVSNGRVTLMRQQFRRGQRTLTAGGSYTTNDIGEYRIFGLAPGQYYVNAIPPMGGIVNGPAAFTLGVLEGDESRSGYAPTFFPGTTDATLAQKLTLAIGQTLSEINIVLVPAKMATITGIAVDLEGRPQGAGFVQVVMRGEGVSGLGGVGGPLRPDGTFSIPNVAPGDYVLRANVPRVPTASGPQAGPPEFSLAFITVNGDDLSGIRIAPVPKVSITGRVSFEDAAAAQSLKQSDIRVATLAATVGDLGIGVGSGGGLLPVNDDFTFDLTTTPGEMAIRAVVPGWQVKAVRVNGTDVTDVGLEVGAQGVSGVEIEMTDQLQEISGRVSDANGNGVSDYAVVMFSQNRSQWFAAFNRYAITTRPGDDGRFKVASLPPGEYYAVAVDHSDAIEAQDPDVLENLTRFATTVSVAPGDKRTLDLKLFTTP